MYPQGQERKIFLILKATLTNVYKTILSILSVEKAANQYLETSRCYLMSLHLSSKSSLYGWVLKTPDLPGIHSLTFAVFLPTHTHTFGSDFLESFPPRCTKYKITQSSLLAKLSLIYLSLEISCKQQKEKNTNHFHFAKKHLQSWTNIPHQIHPTHGIFLPGISMYTCLSVCLFWKAVLLCSLGKPTHNPAISAFQIAGLTGMHHHTRF